MTSINDTTDDRHRTDDRIGLIHVDDGILMYATENPNAWIQTDNPVALVRCQPSFETG